MELLYDDNDPHLTLQEALLITDALMGTALLPHDSAMLWADVDDAISLDGADEKWTVDGPALVARLQGLSRIDARILVERLNSAELLRDVDPTLPLQTSFRLMNLLGRESAAG